MKPFTEDPAALKQARKDIGASQAELAARAGVTRADIANIEAGRVKFTPERRRPIWAAIRALNRERVKRQRSLYDQLIGDFKTRQSAPPSETELLAQYRKLIDAQQSLIETQKQIIRAYQNAEKERNARLAEAGVQEDEIDKLCDFLEIEKKSRVQ